MPEGVLLLRNSEPLVISATGVRPVWDQPL